MHHPSIEQQITFLTTQDLTTTARFYEELLGLQLKLDQGSCKIYTITQTSFLGFCQIVNTSQEHSEDPEYVIFTLVTHEVDAWFTFLESQQVDIEKPPAVNPKYNIYHCFLRDPNGYLIEIQEFLDPAW
jgi:catechol 2,3-dioxygenase-like lactoylglutathione lyase family enzyme